MITLRRSRVAVSFSLAFAALLVVMIRTASAQAPPPQPASPTTTLKATTRLVTVEVVAQDHKGQPVAGLTKDDFELLDDGQPQTISVFSVEGSQITPAPGPQGSPPAELPSGAFTNRPTRPSDIPTSATVILLDRLNTGFQGLSRARTQLEEFIQRLQPRDRVALYVLGANLWVVQDFTSDPKLLLKAVVRIRPEARNVGVASPPDFAKLQAPPSGHFEPTALLPDPGASFRIYDRVSMTLSAFQAIGEHLAHMPGRKTLIWISNGIPITIKNPTPDARLAPNETELTLPIKRVARLLSNYHVAVYPIEARGVGNLLAGFSERGTSFMLGDLTGGRTVYNNNEMAVAIRTAIDDARLVYVLGYYPGQQKWDSKFHTFKVRVGRPGVKLLYRTGYLASPEEQNPNPADPESELGRAIMSPLDSTAIGLRARLQKAGAKGQPATIDLRVDVDDLQLSHDGDRWQGGAEIVIVQRAATGVVLNGSARKHSLNLNLKDDYYTQLKTEGLQLLFPVAPDPNAVELRVVVRDAASGALGSVSIPLAEPDVPKQRNGG